MANNRTRVLKKIKNKQLSMINKQRKILGHSQVDIARILNIPTAQINSIFTGKRLMKPDIRQKLRNIGYRF